MRTKVMYMLLKVAAVMGALALAIPVTLYRG